MLELRSRRFRLQQATTQEQELDPIHPKNSISRQTSLPPHRDRSACSCAKTNTMAATESTASEGGIDDPKERREGSTQRPRSTSYSSKQRTCQPLDEPPPPRHPPHNKPPTPSSRLAVVKIIASEEEIDNPEDRRDDYKKRPHSTIRTIQLRARRPLDD